MVFETKLSLASNSFPTWPWCGLNARSRDPGFPGGSDGKESACSVGDLGSNPGLGRFPGGRHGNPF